MLSPTFLSSSLAITEPSTTSPPRAGVGVVPARSAWRWRAGPAVARGQLGAPGLEGGIQVPPRGEAAHAGGVRARRGRQARLRAPKHLDDELERRVGQALRK